jgi:hypothetical protein
MPLSSFPGPVGFQSYNIPMTKGMFTSIGKALWPLYLTIPSQSRTSWGLQSRVHSPSGSVPGIGTVQPQLQHCTLSPPHSYPQPQPQIALPSLPSAPLTHTLSLPLRVSFQLYIQAMELPIKWWQNRTVAHGEMGVPSGPKWACQSSLLGYKGGRARQSCAWRGYET